MDGTLIEHEPFSIASHAADAATMGGTVIVRTFPPALSGGARDYRVQAGGTVTPPDGYEAVIEDGDVTGMRKALDPARDAPAS